MSGPVDSRKHSKRTEPRRGTSRAEEVYAALLKPLSERRYATNELLPAERDLADRHGVSRPTLRKALLRLVSEGRIVCRPGIGYAVREAPLPAPVRTKPLIGLIINAASDEASSGIRILERRLAESGYSILLGYNDYTVEQENACIDRFLDVGCAGLIVIPAIHGTAYARLNDLIRARFPVVALGEPRAWRIVRELWDMVSLVDVDNAATIHRAMHHLIALGHRRIGLALEEEMRGIQTLRQRAFMGLLREAELPWRDAWLFYADPGIVHSGEEALRLLCTDEAARPTAFLATTDALARHTALLLRELGLHVPWDISVMGIGPAESGERRLSRITYCGEDYAAEAVRLLMEQMAGGTARRKTLLLPEIEEGETAAAPRAGAEIDADRALDTLPAGV